MEAALFQKHLNKHPTHLDHLTENRDTPEAVVIQDYKKTIIQEYRGDWERFFIDWRLKQEKQHLEVVSLIKQKAQQALKDAEEARQKYDTIYEQYVEVQKKLQFIQEEAELQKKLREKKESLKLKKKNAKRME